MCGRLLRLWHASPGYGDRAGGRDKWKLGWLVLIGIPRWCDVWVTKRVRGVGEACSSCRGPRRRGVVEMSSGGVGGYKRSDVGVSSRKTSQRRRDRCDRRVAKLAAVAGIPAPAGA